MLKTLSAALTSVAAAGLFAGSALAGSGIEPLDAVQFATGFTFPIFVTAAPGDYKRLFVVEQRNSGGVASQARIKIIDLTQDPPVVLPTPFITITGVSTASEQGLLGLAFHPDYWNNGHFYVTLTAGGQDVLRRYTVSSDPNVADAGSVQQVWAFADPANNHNGGWIGFGPDGYLYWNMGDGGGGCDTGGRAQDITSQPLGKIHRLDVNGDDFPAESLRNYAIPPSNPFVGIDGDDEIWAFGTRNPWRGSFDRVTGDLWIGDVGQDAATAAQEEVDFQPASSGMPGDAGYYGGRNYGWKCMEGDECSTCPGVVCSCITASMILPLLDYNQGSDPLWGTTGVSITGGYVYRGCSIPSLTGNYFVADYAGGRIWTLRQSGGVYEAGSLVSRTSELDPPGATAITSIASFGEDARGEIYICDRGGGEIFKIVPTTPTIVEQDLDCDGIVGGFDLAILLGGWGKCASPGGCLSDFDGSGATNGLDLAVLLGVWGG